MKKILWLTSWYPNKISPLNGDFIQRHAEATAIFEPVQVIFVVKDEGGIVTKHLTTENYVRGNLSERIIYYKPFISGIKKLDQIISVITYCRIMLKTVVEFSKINGKPKLIHVHVAMLAGIIALVLKWKTSVPYIVTEHWTGYDKKAGVNVYNKGRIFRYLSGLILKQACLILPVSRQLGNLIHNNLVPVKFNQVPNVVNTQYFTLSGYSGKEFRFIHVSSMSSQKNIEGLIRSFSALRKTNDNCKLVMVGPLPVSLKEKLTGEALDSQVEWLGVLTYEQVAKVMAGCSALVLFSRYENQPCVILEALCCGLPVIATDVGGIAEVVSPHNGILVASENEAQLLQAMIEMIKNYEAYDKVIISKNAIEKYSYQSVGEKISALYRAY